MIVRFDLIFQKMHLILLFLNFNQSLLLSRFCLNDVIDRVKIHQISKLFYRLKRKKKFMKKINYSMKKRKSKLKHEFKEQYYLKFN